MTIPPDPPDPPEVKLVLADLTGDPANDAAKIAEFYGKLRGETVTPDLVEAVERRLRERAAQRSGDGEMP